MGLSNNTNLCIRELFLEAERRQVLNRPANRSYVPDWSNCDSYRSIVTWHASKPYPIIHKLLVPNACRFQKWPEDALEAVATKFLREVDVLPDMRKSLMAMCKHFHTSVDTLSRKYLTQVGVLTTVPTCIDRYSCTSS
jgi:hypothetical protein